jgi:hypothetical protein
MKFIPAQLTPVPRPDFSDAIVDGNVDLESRVIVAVKGVGFLFNRVEDGWTGGEALTIRRNERIDEGWITAAREVAIEALRHEVDKNGGQSTATGTLQCPDCRRLMCSKDLVDAGRPSHVECGPTHLAFFEDKNEALSFRPDGSTAWVNK